MPAYFKHNEHWQRTPKEILADCQGNDGPLFLSIDVLQQMQGLASGQA